MNSLVILNPEDGREPWEKLDEETPRAFSAFKTYRDLPSHGRSLARAVIKLYGEPSKSKLRQFQTWSAKYGWVERALAWDLEVDRVSRVSKLAAIKDMNERQIRVGKVLQQKAIERLKEFDNAELTPEMILRYVQVGMQLERVALGQPTEITESHNQNMNLNAVIDYTEKSDDELRKVIQQKGLCVQ